MASMDEQVLRAAKEITVKFIEVGRLSPTGFHETFKEVYQTIHATVINASSAAPADRHTDQAHPQKG